MTQDPLLKKILVGKTKTHIVCHKCGNHREFSDEFSFLSVPIRTEGWEGLPRTSEYMCRSYGCTDDVFRSEANGTFGSSFVSVLNHGTSESIQMEKGLQSLFISTQCECEQCSSNDCEMFQVLEELPEIFTIQVTRYGRRWFGIGKMHQNVSFPHENVDFSHFLPMNITCTRTVYDLVAVIFHVGLMNVGHYQCYAKTHNQWYLYNDDNVTKVDLKTVLNSQCYILFYKKRTSPEIKVLRKRFKDPVKFTPIFVFSDPKWWKESFYCNNFDRANLKDEIKDAEELAGCCVTREKNNDDLRREIIYNVPRVNRKVPLSREDAERIMKFITEDVPPPVLHASSWADCTVVESVMILAKPGLDIENGNAQNNGNNSESEESLNTQNNNNENGNTQNINNENTEESLSNENSNINNTNTQNINNENVNTQNNNTENVNTQNINNENTQSENTENAEEITNNENGNTENAQNNNMENVQINNTEDASKDNNTEKIDEESDRSGADDNGKEEQNGKSVNDDTEIDKEL
ncbi:Clan CA, family C19, ubiquitin hydrolase-like cysteine peptidase [Histomonas meleagridis]|uniref:Clan CA, family C19, ubiquitin hydrolase-like cysteine peptidase n=1 Tax=Histomonas meleagridis TaxID=135588 RepID=UPI00355A6175|nr:Clan CA, family C19, ubiquitin hydrolase-like cysteine peptidase [Histomonas meleagridis]KAH0804503.1 Clan CA, family C19, ubiquitin hydrolase-like cysteine peptidase [Histomonas meleagridis]